MLIVYLFINNVDCLFVYKQCWLFISNGLPTKVLYASRLSIYDLLTNLCFPWWSKVLKEQEEAIYFFAMFFFERLVFANQSWKCSFWTLLNVRDARTTSLRAKLGVKLWVRNNWYRANSQMFNYSFRMLFHQNLNCTQGYVINVISTDLWLVAFCIRNHPKHPIALFGANFAPIVSFNCVVDWYRHLG